MARCEQGYLCAVCGKDVENLEDSDLYLRYLLGEVNPERLHLEPEMHIRCVPERAQYILHEGFSPLQLKGPFSKTNLDAGFVEAEEARVSAAYKRLISLNGLGLSILEYPPGSSLESS